MSDFVWAFKAEAQGDTCYVIQYQIDGNWVNFTSTDILEDIKEKSDRVKVRWMGTINSQWKNVEQSINSKLVNPPLPLTGGRSKRGSQSTNTRTAAIRLSLPNQKTFANGAKKTKVVEITKR